MPSCGKCGAGAAATLAFSVTTKDTIDENATYLKKSQPEESSQEQDPHRWRCR